MKISVQIPTYNRKTMVAEALRKIFSFQPRSYHEVIVSDNHSTDGTEKALFQEFGNQIIFTRPGKHVPAYENWRHAYLQATGTHVHFHWSDDWLERNFYHAAVERLQSSGDAIAATTARIVEEDGFDSIHYSQGFSRELGWETALRRLFFEEGGILPYSPMAYIIKKDLIQSHWYSELTDMGGVSPITLAIGPDALLVAGAILESGKQKMRLQCLSGPYVNFRKHKESITEKNLEHFRLYRHCFDWFIQRHDVQLSTPPNGKASKFRLIWPFK